MNVAAPNSPPPTSSSSPPTRSQAVDAGRRPATTAGRLAAGVVVTISDFGWTGPYADRAASEFTLQAWSGSTGFPRRSRRAADLDRRRAGRVHGWRVRRVRRRWRCAAASSSGGPGEHLDLSMLEAITLMQSSEWLHSQLLQRAADPPHRRGAVDRTRQRRLRRDHHGHRSAVARLRRDGRMPGARRRSNSCGSRSGGGHYRDLIREQIDPGWPNGPSTRSSSSASCSGCRSRALGNGSTIRGHGLRARARRLHPQPRRIPSAPAPWLMSRCGPAPRARHARRSARPTTNRLGAKGTRGRDRRCDGLPLGRCAHRRPDRVLGRPGRDPRCWPRSAPTSSRSSRSSVPTASDTPAGCAPTSTTGGSTAGCSTR